MTERITPAEVRGQSATQEAVRGYPSPWLLRLAAQMEADAVELADLTASTELFAKCLDRAGRMWLAARPDKKLMWPDGAVSIVWVLEQNEALAAKVAELEDRLAWINGDKHYEYVPKNSVPIRLKLTKVDSGIPDLSDGEEPENLAAKVTALEERMKGRVLVPVVVFNTGDEWEAILDVNFAYAWRTIRSGNSAEEATANIQAAIDKESANA